MKTSLLTFLKCPFCSGELKASGDDKISNKIEYGILTCYCSSHPVVAGIPVLKFKNDKNIEKVTTLVEAGRNSDALLTLLQPDSLSLPSVWKLSSYLPYGNWLRNFAHQKMLKKRQERAEALLTDQRGQVTACELLDFYSSNKEHYNYFAFQYGQPRYLVALSLGSLILQPKKMILDLCCGYGNISRSIGYQANGQQVIGVDKSFFGLYVAKHWVAPEAEYICCSADSMLPFIDGVFSVSFCSDAFPYIINKPFCVQELKRITKEGVIILTAMHNKFLGPPASGLFLSPEGYQLLFNDIPHRILPDEDILDRYLLKEGPDLSTQPKITYLNQKRLLSIVASTQKDIFCKYGSFVDWPHARGRLEINPLYKMEVIEGAIGKIRLRRRFPSPFYEERHPEYKKYMPEKIELDSTILSDLADGKRTSAIEKLVEQVIVLGVPDKFYKDPSALS